MVQGNNLLMISICVELSGTSTLKAKVVSASEERLFERGACLTRTVSNLSNNRCTMILYSAKDGSRIANSPKVCFTTRLESPLM